VSVRSSLLAAAAAWAALVAVAQAQDFTSKHAGLFVADVRLSDVTSNASDAITTAAGAASGLHVAVGDSYVPTLGLEYFFTDHLAAELVLGTSHHDIHAVGSGVNVKVADTWVVPPVLTLQYHFAPKARFSPYVGAGLNAMVFYGASGANGFRVQVKDSVGAALQLGADYAVQGPWTLNVDVKKVFVEDDASINSQALRSKVNLDPWVLSLGFGRRF